MVEVWTEQIVMARYHLSVFGRLIEYYNEAPEKRFFIGALNELTRSATNLINAVLMQAESDCRIKVVKNPDKNLKSFGAVAENYLKNPETIFEILRIKGDYKKSPVSYDKGGEVLFLVDGKYKVLTLSKLVELAKSLTGGMGELKII
jgi:hypothetical protein